MISYPQFTYDLFHMHHSQYIFVIKQHKLLPLAIIIESFQFIEEVKYLHIEDREVVIVSGVIVAPK